MPVAVRDDRVLVATRVVSAVIAPVLAAAFVILFLFPGSTDRLWAWTIDAEMTAMLMGAGYLAGAYFFVRAATVGEWHRIGLGLPAITAFAGILGLTTFLHWDRFNHDHVAFWAWLALYTATPVLLPLLWVANRKTDRQVPEPGEVLVPRPLRLLVGAVGAVQLASVLAMLVRPSVAIEGSPWALTPLTARALAGFFAFPAVTWLCFLVDERWSSLRIPVQTVTVGLALIVVAAVRAAPDFGDGWETWGFRVAVVAGLLLLVVLQVAMERGKTAEAPA